MEDPPKLYAVADCMLENLVHLKLPVQSQEERVTKR